MKIPKFLKFLMPVLVCISLIRAVNGAGGLSLDSVLLQLQSFSFDFQEVSDLIALFQNNSLLDSFVGWNSNLTGVEGFFINVGNILSSFFTMIGTVVTSLIKALWNLIVEIVRLIAQIFNIVSNVLGFGVSVPVSS